MLLPHVHPSPHLIPWPLVFGPTTCLPSLLSSPSMRVLSLHRSLRPPPLHNRQHHTSRPPRRLLSPFSALQSLTPPPLGCGLSSHAPLSPFLQRVPSSPAPACLTAVEPRGRLRCRSQSPPSSLTRHSPRRAPPPSFMYQVPRSITTSVETPDTQILVPLSPEHEPNHHRRHALPLPGRSAASIISLLVPGNGEAAEKVV